MFWAVWSTFRGMILPDTLDFLDVEKPAARDSLWKMIIEMVGFSHRTVGLE